MRVHFAQNLSHNMLDKFNVVSDLKKELVDFFERKTYGNDVDLFIIGIRCLSPMFEDTFPKSKPKYNRHGKVLSINNDDGPVKSADKILSYTLTLNYSKYNEITDIRSIFPQDALNSLDVISTIKQIKDFDLAKFKSDFEAFFKSIDWI